MGTRKKVINDYIRASDHVMVRACDNDHFVAVQTTDLVKLDAAGVGVLVGTLTQWLADRADRL